MSFQAWLGGLLAFLFFGALFWAKGRDPFQRIWFSVKTSNYGKVKCIAVLPKTGAPPLPVVVYLHGSGGSLLGSGNELRQMAEMGLAAVGMDYSQTDDAACEAQFRALLSYLQQQRWADTNAMVWVGYSLGAQRQLRFLLKSPDSQPKVLVRLAGGWVPELEQLKVQGSEFMAQSSSSKRPSTFNSQLSSVLLIHGDRDEEFPISEVERVATVLRTNEMVVSTKIVPAQNHALRDNRAVIFRAIGEYCLTHFKGPEALGEYRSIASWQAKAKPLWLFWLPGSAWIGAWLYYKRRTAVGAAPNSDSPPLGERVVARPGEGIARKRKLTRWEIGLRWLAGILALLASAQTALHVILPRLPISDRTLAIARKHLVQPKELGDFDSLAPDSVWRGKQLKTLLTHVELANYNRELVNWKLDDSIYQQFVLSPRIDPKWDGQMDWRRPLWESFYPRIRKENSLEAAAEIVARHLRERVTVTGGKNLPAQIESIWLRQISNTNGFERIYVAALRSTGIPARLDPRGQAQFWTEAGWKPGPRPLFLYP